MHKIFAYTIPFTGTRFMNNIFREGVPGLSFMGDYHARIRGRGQTPLDTMPCGGICKAWWDRNIMAYATSEEKASRIFFFHTHCGSPDSEILSSLIRERPEYPTIISIRDPLLIINTAIWHNYSLKNIIHHKEPVSVREERAHKIAETMEKMLSIPKKHAFIFPTDLVTRHSPRDRLHYVTRMVEFSGLEVTDKISSLVNKWRVIGNTGETKRLQKKDRAKGYLKYKKAIVSRDKPAMKRLLDVELACLSEHKRLRSLMERIGYSTDW